MHTSLLKRLLSCTLILLLGALAAPALAQSPALVQTPAITGFLPAAGAAPGTSIIITGVNLNRSSLGVPWSPLSPPPYRIQFHGPSGAWINGTGLRLISSARIAVTVPEGAVTGTIRLIEGAYVRLSPSAFPVLPRPSLSGPAGHGAIGESVLISGANLNRNADGSVWSGSPSYQIQFPGASGFINAIFSVQSATSLRAFVPSGAVSGPIRLISGSYTSQAQGSFTVDPLLPRVTSVNPTAGFPGAAIAITGANLNRDGRGNPWTSATPPYRIQLPTADGFIDLPFTYLSPTLLNATIPQGARTGRIRIVDGDYAASLNFDFTVLTTPELTGVSPASGPIGSQVTISGTSLDRGASGLQNSLSSPPPYQIQFASVAGFINAPFTRTSATQITATVPAGAVTGVIRLVQGDYIRTTPAVFTVTNAPPTPTVFRIQNFSQLAILHVRIDGFDVQLPGPVGPGLQIDIPNSTNQAGFIAHLEVDLGTAGASEDVWATSRVDNISIPANQVTIRIIGRIRVPQILTNFGPQSTFRGDYFDANGGVHSAAFVFNAAGGWTFFDDGVQRGAGSVAEISWPNFSSIITFGLGGGQNTQIAEPFASFQLRNGPPSWPIIEYVRQ